VGKGHYRGHHGTTANFCTKSYYGERLNGSSHQHSRHERKNHPKPQSTRKGIKSSLQSTLALPPLHHPKISIPTPLFTSTLRLVADLENSVQNNTARSQPNTSLSKENTNMSSKKTNKAKDYDYLFKLVLIGDSGVGKSCLLLRFAVSGGLDWWSTLFIVRSLMFVLAVKIGD
jgi:RecA-family ATPase